MSDKNYNTSTRPAAESEEKTYADKYETGSHTEAKAWSKKTGLPAHLYSRSKEFNKKHADMSKLDEHGRPTHTKDGKVILRFR